MENIYSQIDKYIAMKAFALLFLLLFAGPTLFAQATNDDVYFSPKDEVEQPETTTSKEEPKPSAPAETYDYDEPDYTDGYYDDEDNYTSPSNSETRTDGDGNTYITNNYYGDYYEDNSYSTRLRRYYTPYSGFGYYSPCYSGYYDPWYGSGWSVSVNVGWGYPYYGGGWGGYNSWGYWDPWYPSYYGGYYGGWGYPYGGGGYWGGYNHGYWHGYNNGYWNGYNDGYYYGGGGYYGGGSTGGYYYGPRRGGIGYSSRQNAEKQTQQISTPGKTVNQFPIGENRDVVKPVNTGRTVVEQNGSQPVRNPEVKSGSTVQPADRGNVQPAPSRGDVKPVERYDVKENENKGSVQPAPARGNDDKEVKTAPNTGGYQPRTNENAVEKAPAVDRGQVAPKPAGGNVERQAPARQPVYERNDEPEQRRNENVQQQQPQQQPARQPVYERNDEPEQRSNENRQPQNRNENVEQRQPQQQPARQPQQQYQPKNDNAPRQAPKTYERAPQQQAPQQAPRTMDRGNNYSAPAPSNNNRGSGTMQQRAPQGGGRGGYQPR